MATQAEVFDGADAPTPLTADEQRELARVQRGQDAVQLARDAASSGKGGEPAGIDTGRAFRAPQLVTREPGALALGPYAAPIDLDPRNIDALLPKNTKNEPEHADVLASMRAAFESAFTGLQAVGKARTAAQSNDAWTPSQQLLRVGEMADKTVDRVMGSFDKAHKFLTDFIAALDKSLSAPLEGGTRDQLAIEIRDHVKSLPENKRGAFVGEALKKNDLRTLQAVLGAPAFLSGLGESHHTLYIRQYREQSNPAASARLAIARKGLERLEARAGLILREAERAMGGSFAKLKKIRETNSAAEQALIMSSALE